MLIRHKIPNLFLFPIIVGMCRLYVNDLEKYASFKELAYDKMFNWQWEVLDKIMGGK